MRVGVKFFLFLVITCVGLCSCSEGYLKPADYVKYVLDESNGLKQVKKVGNFEFSLQYKPVDYMILLGDKNSTSNKSSFEQKVSEMKDMEYFTLRISSVDKTKEVFMCGISSEKEYYTRNDYFSFDFQNDIQLIRNNDTIPCVVFNFARNFGLAPYADFVFAFEKKTPEFVDETVVISEKMLGSGILKFGIEKKNIESTPHLLIN